MIKMITIDLDGTLLNDSREISLKNKETLTKAREMGIHIVLCTGRPILGIKKYLEFLDLVDLESYCITYNGGLVQRVGDKKVYHQSTMTLDEIKELYQLSQDLDLPMNYIDLDNVYVPEHPEGRPSMYSTVMNLLPFVEKEFDEFPEGAVFQKVVYSYEKEVLDQALENIPADFENRYSMMRSRPILFEFMPLGVTKATGIQALMNILDIKQDEVMAIGDQENDLAMIEFAGTGVAMANAVPEILEIADYVTLSNEEDGVAYAIEELVFKERGV